MIDFFSEVKFKLDDKARVSKWISETIQIEGFEEGEIVYIFCDDDYLHNLNVEYLNHDTLTDIISFDYSLGNQLHGEVYISIDRVEENAAKFNVAFETELRRVIIHGILHYCGYKDKTDAEIKQMRAKEEEALGRF